MIVYLHGEKLWVDGDKAYSVEEVRSTIVQLKDSATELKSELDKLDADITELTAKRESLVSRYNEVAKLLSESELISSKIDSDDGATTDTEEVAVVDEAATELTKKNIKLPKPFKGKKILLG